MDPNIKEKTLQIKSILKQKGMKGSMSSGRVRLNSESYVNSRNSYTGSMSKSIVSDQSKYNKENVKTLTREQINQF